MTLGYDPIIIKHKRDFTVSVCGVELDKRFTTMFAASEYLDRLIDEYEVRRAEYYS